MIQRHRQRVTDRCRVGVTDRESMVKDTDRVSESEIESQSQKQGVRVRVRDRDRES